MIWILIGLAVFLAVNLVAGVILRHYDYQGPDKDKEWRERQ